MLISVGFVGLLLGISVLYALFISIGCVLPTFQPGVTPLHVSCARDSLDVVQLLLSVPGIDVNIKDAINRTPVMRAHDYRILALLKKYTKCCDDFPVHTVTKVVLCGNTGAGKSTLAQVRIIDFKCSDDGVILADHFELAIIIS